MATNRKVIDCRWFPSENACDIAISGSEEDVLNIAVQHAVQSHGHRDTPELRDQLRSMLRDESKIQGRLERFPRSYHLSELLPAVAPCWSQRSMDRDFGIHHLGNRYSRRLARDGASRWRIRSS